MSDPYWSGDFVGNTWVSPDVARNLFLLSTGVQGFSICQSALGLMCFEARTNLLWPNGDFTSSRWTKARVTVTPNADIAPDGTMTATLLTDAAGSGWHGAYMAAAVSAGSLYVASIPVKKGSVGKGRIWFVNGSAGGYADFDLDAGTIVKSSGMSNAALLPMCNGWFNAVLVGSCANTTAYFQIDVCNESGQDSYAGNGARSLLIGRANLQFGSTLGPDISTSTGGVTRPADSYVRSIPEVTAVTKVIRARTAKLTPPPGEAQVLWHIDDGTEVNDLEAWRDSNGHMIAEIHQGDVSRAKIDLGFVANDTDFAIAISASPTCGLTASLNGGTPVNLPVSPWPTGMISEKIGTNAWMMNPPAGYVPRYWNSTVAYEATYLVAITGADLQALSCVQ